ncbi:MAG: LysE family transporter [Bacteroidaceae bacterium]|jgi:threonine/homoserine/homoserine lactone efflux protein|nr:LysE family transporter [Bacteroidaceae bacterium]
MWIQPVNTIDLFVKGLIVGILASAPMGPVGILTIQRTLNKGRWYGMMTGVGAAFSDIIYAAISILGMSFVMDFVENPLYMFWFQLIGSVLLMIFGIYTYFSNPKTNLRPASQNRGTLMHNGFTGFLVTFSNPLIILLFIALMARFEFVVPEHYFEQAVGYSAIFAGALIWWFGLTYAINKVRNRFQENTICLINKTIGIIVIVASILGMIWALIQKFWLGVIQSYL